MILWLWFHRAGPFTVLQQLIAGVGVGVCQHKALDPDLGGREVRQPNLSWTSPLPLQPQARGGATL